MADRVGLQGDSFHCPQNNTNMTLVGTGPLQDEFSSIELVVRRCMENNATGIECKQPA